MNSLSEQIFNKQFYYNPQLVEKYVKIILSSTEEANDERAARFKKIIFKMMGNIVNKNITNYLNLIRGAISEPPTRDDLIADCYFVLDKCVYKFKTDRGYDFYYYYNKSLARNFYTQYRNTIKEVNRKSEIEVCMINDENTVTMETNGGIGMLLGMLNLTQLERKICEYKMDGRNSVDFMNDNKTVTKAQYSAAFSSLKKKLEILRKEQQL